MRSPGRRGLLATALAALSLAAGCGSGTESGGSTALPSDFSKALDQAPKQVAELYASGDQLLQGGEATYEKTLAGVEGLPLVVNNWASWCGPCRTEFPFFQALAVKEVKRVAFLGVVSEDSEPAAETFLRDNPLPYPSVVDPGGDLASWIDNPLVGYPNTLFYDREGELAYVKQGPYETEDGLAADIERYALGGASTDG